MASLREQVVTNLRQQILGGQRASGERLPASRILASDLAVSRNTVVQAYEQLIAEGYLETRPGSGTFVAPIALPAGTSQAGQSGRNPHLSSVAERLAAMPRQLIERQATPPGVLFDFRYGEPGYDTFPVETWARIVARTARELAAADLGYAPVDGLPVLREALAGYLTRARGLSASSDDIIVVQGTQEAVDLLVRLHVDPGDAVAVESPFYRGFVRSALASGARLMELPTDDEGLMVEALDNASDARLLFVTPSHQFPGGGILPVSRRMDILEWAHRHNVTVFEDDYDGEFRYAGSPVPSLKSLDERDLVTYVGTASKTFFPSLRLGWMLLPATLKPHVSRLKSVMNAVPPTLEQLAFAQFIVEGHFERHIHRTRKVYARKRKRLLATLGRRLGNRAELKGTDAGIHVVLRLPDLAPLAVPKLIDACASAGVAIYDTSSSRLSPAPMAELLLGYSAIDEGVIEAAADRLADVLVNFDG